MYDEWPHNIPNPCAYLIALSRRSFNFSLVEYSGSNSTLKQVWAVGNL